MRTPLQALFSELDSLTQSNFDAAIESRSIALMREVASDMSSTIDRVADYLKTISGVPLRPHIATVNVCRCLRQIAAESNLDFFAPLSMDEVLISTDEKWFRDNANICIANTRKYSENCSIRLRVQNDVNSNNLCLINPTNNSFSSMLCFEVVDKGCGLSEQNISQLFEPFSNQG
jgi:signal transduction histidine kinase